MVGGCSTGHFDVGFVYGVGGCDPEDVVAPVHMNKYQPCSFDTLCKCDGSVGRAYRIRTCPRVSELLPFSYSVAPASWMFM